MLKVFLLLLSLSAFALGAIIEDCGSDAEVNVNEITVTGCDNTPRPCIFQKGTHVSISLPFTPRYESQKVKAVVHGIIAGVPVPFRLSKPDACEGSGLRCPLKPDTKVTYTASLPVLKMYPSISVEVKWELMDGNKKLVCILIPVVLK